MTTNQYVNLSILRGLLLEHTPNEYKRVMLMQTKLVNYARAVASACSYAVPTRMGLLVPEEIARQVLDTPLIEHAMRPLKQNEQPSIFNDVEGIFIALAEAKGPLAKLTKAESRAKRKAIKKAQSKRKRQHHNEALKEAMSATDKMIIFLDVEWYERSKGKVTEIGYTLIENGKHSGTHHILISERMNLRNKKFVPDNKDNFNFGSSMKMTLKDALEHLRTVLVHCDIIIGHSVGGDITVLTHALGHKHRSNIHSMFKGKQVVDTVHSTNKIAGQRMSIMRCLDHFGIEHSHLHNAGNDAHYNWLVAQELATV
ncbi:MAG: hypothetical protein JXR12_06485 [Neptunomonas phycophila]|uniref:hypothetical protein n=1 Tax=Neptunomonas phycophila TaxID=1572645 RepID=UPI003B8CDDA2